MRLQNALPQTILSLISILLAAQFVYAEPLLSRRRLLTTRPKAIITGQATKVALLDADGNIRPALRPGVPPNFPHEVELLPYTAELIQDLNAKDYLVVIVSNQGGIPQYASLEQVDATMKHTVDLLGQKNAIVHYYDFAESFNSDRKPDIGMGLRLENYLKLEYGVTGIDRENSIMIGDAAWMRASKGNPAEIRPDGRPGFNHSNADRLFAQNLGVRFIESADFFKWRERHGIDAFENLADLKKFLKNNPEIARLEKCEHLLR